MTTTALWAPTIAGAVVLILALLAQDLVGIYARERRANRPAFALRVEALASSIGVIVAPLLVVVLLAVSLRLLNAV